jgi:hypothetical protein
MMMTGSPLPDNALKVAMELQEPFAKYGNGIHSYDSRGLYARRT